MDELFKQRVAALENSGYLKQFSNIAMNSTCAFWWSGFKEPGGLLEVFGNGTLCLLNTGTRHIAVTCDHVYEGYLEHVAKYHDVTCQFGNNTIDPQTRLISRSPINQFDLATFDIPEVFVHASERHYHHNAMKWPPDPLQKLDAVLFGGFPQALREPKKGEAVFPFQWIAGGVNSVDDKVIVLEPNVKGVYWHGHEGMEINESFGGQSGGPVFRVIDANHANGEYVDRMELVGFIDRQYLGEFVLAKHADHVAADGTVGQRPVK